MLVNSCGNDAARWPHILRMRWHLPSSHCSCYPTAASHLPARNVLSGGRWSSYFYKYWCQCSKHSTIKYIIFNSRSSHSLYSSVFILSCKLEVGSVCVKVSSLSRSDVSWRDKWLTPTSAPLLHLAHIQIKIFAEFHPRWINRGVRRHTDASSLQLKTNLLKGFDPLLMLSYLRH